LGEGFKGDKTLLLIILLAKMGLSTSVQIKIHIIRAWEKRVEGG
jgi:hypothetical protein